MVATRVFDAWEADVLGPVPLHRARLRERGYNQAERLAAAISTSTGIPVVEVVARTRLTETQVGLNGPERQANVAGAFTARGRLDGRSIVLIDDVVTTGATLVECARACRAAGASSVRALVLATEV